MTFLAFKGLPQSGSSHQISLCLYIHVPYIYMIMCILSMEQRLQPLLQLDASLLLRVLVTKKTLWMLEFLHLKNNDLAALSEYWVSHLILTSFQYLFIFLCTGLECVGQSVGSLLTSVLGGHIMTLPLHLDENGMGCLAEWDSNALFTVHGAIFQKWVLPLQWTSWFHICLILLKHITNFDCREH